MTDPSRRRLDERTSELGVSPLPYRLKVSGSVTRYQSCVVDPRPGRAVHCPDLNACLVNEGRPVPVDCQAVHFGYAIPVNVVPLPEEPALAELVFDPTPDLTPEAVAYLLRHHPQYKNRREEVMATTKHEHVRNKYVEQPEEDIAAIAKQISDHAEAIYQTWKSRGLAPAEILNCHGDATAAADKFGTALTPEHRRVATTPSPPSPPPPPSINANNLEQLVNNFVVEDKARLARQHHHKAAALPSSIQFALQKFEKSGKPSPPYQPENGPAKPSVHYSPKPSPPYHALQSDTPNQYQTLQSDTPKQYSSQKPSPPYHVLQPEPPKQYSPKPSPPYHALQPEPPKQYAPKPSPPYTKPSQSFHVVEEPVQYSPKCQSSKPLQETIESIFPAELKASEPEGSGLTTWPLKNKAATPAVDPPKDKYATLPSNNNNNNAEYMDEVAREEERLINALKTGIIIAEEPPGLAGSQVAEKKKKSLLLKKTNKDKAKKNAKVKIDVTSPVTSPVKSPTREEIDLSNLSLVDYAKVRYRAAQQQTSLTQQRLEDVKQLELQVHGGHHIEATRNKFEPDAAEEERSQAAVHRRQKSIAAGKKAVPRHPPTDGVPHPELTNQQRLRAQAHATTNPVRPFLTRGSVAERVLIFEKCPTELLLDKRRGTPAIHAWRSGHDVQSKAQCYAREKEPSCTKPAPNSLPPNTTLQRHVKANRSGVHIPRFYFPRGKPQPESVEATLHNISTAFQQFPSQQVPRDKFSVVTKACDCPLYWKIPLFIAAGGEKLGYLDLNTFLEFWKKLTSSCHDEAAKYMYIITKGARDFILPEDMMALVQDVVDTHPGLTFLKEAIEFHSRYVHTVIARIYYCTNRSWSGRINLPELRRSNLLRVIRLLELEDDINQVTAFFSYEHFYVIYCKFWELDRDHDLLIDKNDLQRHNDHALSSRMIERIFSGAVTRGLTAQREEKMSYTEFVWFLLSEEDKNHPTAIEYWFRCMDLDGDGYLSMYELEFFYEEQLQRLDAIGIETLPFQDCLCQMLDMIHPAAGDKISLSDLKRCKMTSIFFDTFFNLEKYLEHEQKDPFAAQRDHGDGMEDASDWDRFAADEYEALVAEEGGGGGGDDMGLYSDEFDGEDMFSPNLDRLLATTSSEGGGAGAAGGWTNPTFKVTDFDLDEDDYEDEEEEEGDYARDSDDCSV